MGTTNLDALTLSGALTVGGATTLTGAQTFTGATTFSSTISVAGVSTISAQMNFGALSSSTQTGITLVAATPSVFNVFADDNNTTLTNAVYSTIRGRTMLFKDAGGVTITSVKGQIKGAAGVDFGTGVYSGVQGYIELVGTHQVTASGKMAALQGEIEVVTALTVTGASAQMSGASVALTGAGTVTEASTGILSGYLVTSTASTAIWPVAFRVVTGKAAIGLSMATTTQGVVSVVSALPANARGDSFKYTCATPAMSDGYGAFEIDLTTSGVGTGNAAASSSWVNIPTGTAAAGGYICARTDGIWEASAATVTNSYLIFGAKMTADIGDTDFDRLVPFCLNSTQDMSALFMIGSADSKVGITLGAGGMATQAGSAKMFIDSNGAIYYVKLYVEAAS